MLASRMIISASRSLSRTPRLLEFRNYFFFILIGESRCKAVCRSAEFGLIRRPIFRSRYSPPIFMASLTLLMSTAGYPHLYPQESPAPAEPYRPSANHKS